MKILSIIGMFIVMMFCGGCVSPYPKWNTGNGLENYRYWDGNGYPECKMPVVESRQYLYKWRAWVYATNSKRKGYTPILIYYPNNYGFLEGYSFCDRFSTSALFNKGDNGKWVV